MELVKNILPFLYSGIIIYFLWKKNPLKSFGISSSWAIGIFTLKVLAGTALWFIYTYYYVERSTSDAFRFFDDAKVIHRLLLTDTSSYLKFLFGFGADDPKLDQYIVQMFNWEKEYNYFLYNDSRTMIRFNVVSMLFSFGNYHVHTVFMSLFSFLGSTYLFKAFYPYLKDKKYLLLVAVFCIPSVLLYSSGVLKEGILMAGIGFFFYCIFRLPEQYKKPKYWIVLLVAIMIMLTMKIYVILCLAPAIAYFLASRYVLKNRPFLLFLSFNVLFFFGFYTLAQIFPEKDIFYMLYKKKDDFVNVAMQYEAGSFFVTPDLHPDPWSFLKYIPFAIITVLTRPYFWEQGSLLIKAAGIENLILCLCLFVPIFFRKKITIEDKRIVYFLITFIFYLYILIGTTTPVLGALSRYKVPALPFLLIICLFCLNSEKAKRILPFKNL